MLTKKYCFIFILSFMMSLYSVNATLLQINATNTPHDSYTDGSNTSQNNGQINVLRLINTSTLQYNSYVMFNISMIPPGQQITDAVAYVDGFANQLDVGTEGFNVSVYAINGSWIENGITYATAPALDTTLLANLNFFGGAGEPTTIFINVTAMVSYDYAHGNVSTDFALIPHSFFGSPIDTDILSIRAQEFDNVSQSFWLNITYDAAPAGDCTYSSSNWVLLGSYGCNITSVAANPVGSNLTISSSGYTSINGSVTGFLNKLVSGGSVLTVYGGGLLG